MKKLILTATTVLLYIITIAQSDKDSSINKNWSYHFQITGVSQGHPSFKAVYSGNNSLSNASEAGVLSVTSTAYIGRKLWKGAAMYVDPEVAGGKGISSAKGVAGFTNGETFRIGDPAPALYIARAYVQQHIPLRGTQYETISDDANQVTETIPTSRITISAGKFAISDFYDNNEYSHDPRTQFLNWSLMSNGAWDYPANTRGYTMGIVTELIKSSWALRLSMVQMPRTANGSKMDFNIFKANGLTLEFEQSYHIKKQVGTIRLLAFQTTSQAPTYHNTIKEIQMGDSSSVNVYTGDYEWKKYSGKKYGFGINISQHVNDNIGCFLRSSWNDGRTATWVFTEIDRSISTGINMNGKIWKRKFDNIGIAFVVNGLSKDHRDFLNTGLYGFIIGDGKLSNYGTENIAELYYQAKLFNNLFFMVDYQFVKNPAYNKDRGPVHVFAARMHVEF